MTAVAIVGIVGFVGRGLSIGLLFYCSSRSPLCGALGYHFNPHMTDLMTAGALLTNVREVMMTDRGYVEKAADTGAGKVSLLHEDPLRYMFRAVAPEWA